MAREPPRPSRSVVPDTKTEQHPIVDPVVEALAGDGSGSVEDAIAAARDLGELGSPKQVGKLLRGHLEERADDEGALFAMFVLCYGRPKLARRLQFAMVAEGRRLASMIRRGGDQDRAQEVLEALARRHPDHRGVEKDLAAVMRRTGNAEQLVERYLARAEEAEACGRRRDAITWLREVLLLDAGRRDVARMIRDLQYESRRVRGNWRRRLRVVGLLIVLAGLIGLVVVRDLQIRSEYEALQPAEPGNRASLEARLASLDQLIESNPLWHGMFEAGRERADLRSQVERLVAREIEVARRDEDERTERRIQAETALVLARRMVETLDFDGAAAQYRLALESAPENWSERERTEVDLAAVERHREGRR